MNPTTKFSATARHGLAVFVGTAAAAGVDGGRLEGAGGNKWGSRPETPGTDRCCTCGNVACNLNIPLTPFRELYLVTSRFGYLLITPYVYVRIGTFR